jgi:mRNA-degrading endonuclease RelE of RelBE toxin-antitoxin system
VLFIESPVFTADVCDLLSDEEYSELQQYLADNPAAGDLIQGTGGLRKLRWSAQGRGKRGGVRIIYFYVVALTQIRLLLIYWKGIKDDLTPREKAVLRRINQGW